jgi:hypothetical protein
VGGIFDHYFFNLNFPHSVSIFWIYLGLAMVTVRLGTRAEIGNGDEKSRMDVTAQFAV